MTEYFTTLGATNDKCVNELYNKLGRRTKGMSFNDGVCFLNARSRVVAKTDQDEGRMELSEELDEKTREGVLDILKTGRRLV